MSKGIRLSKKHGVNPTMGICFFCNKPTGEIALLGQLKGDVEAPKHSVLSYEPCDKCKELFNTGVPLIECTERDLYRSISLKTTEGADIYPTGRYMIVTQEFVENLFDRHAELGKPIAIDVELYEAIDNRFNELKLQEELSDADGQG